MWAHKYIHSCFTDSFGQVVLVMTFTKIVVSALWLTAQDWTALQVVNCHDCVLNHGYDWCDL